MVAARQVVLSCRYLLYSKRVTTWPLDLVFGLAVRACGRLLDVLSHSGGTDNSHTAYTFVTSQYFLHDTSCLDLAEGPLLTRNSFLMRRRLGRGMQPVLRHFMRSAR